MVDLNSVFQFSQGMKRSAIRALLKLTQRCDIIVQEVLSPDKFVEVKEISGGI